jgi:hypothetical protein
MNKKKKNFYLFLTLTLFLHFFIADNKQKVFSQQNPVSLASDEYYPYHPTGCRYVKKLQIERVLDYYFVQPCSRSGGTWLQQIVTVETSTKGVIYVKGENLVNGLTLGSGYWCSLKAPGFKNTGRAGTCTKDGWKPSQPQ